MSLTKVHILFDRWFWHRIRIEWSTPFHHRYKTQETLFPYRYAYSHIFHLPLTKLGIVIGRWSGTGTSQSLLEAVDGGIIGEVAKDWGIAVEQAGCSENCPAQHDAVGLGEALDAGGSGHPPDADEFY